ncbi:hypothetical protein KKF84_11175 [Myxococcota bacterium]|nr:hypothetical protein [Myxococcota bacterium]
MAARLVIPFLALCLSCTTHKPQVEETTVPLSREALTKPRPLDVIPDVEESRHKAPRFSLSHAHETCRRGLAVLATCLSYKLVDRQKIVEECVRDLRSDKRHARQLLRCILRFPKDCGAAKKCLDMIITE